MTYLLQQGWGQGHGALVDARDNCMRLRRFGLLNALRFVRLMEGGERGGWGDALRVPPKIWRFLAKIVLYFDGLPTYRIIIKKRWEREWGMTFAIKCARL